MGKIREPENPVIPDSESDELFEENESGDSESESEQNVAPMVTKSSTKAKALEPVTPSKRPAEESKPEAKDGKKSKKKSKSEPEKKVDSPPVTPSKPPVEENEPEANDEKKSKKKKPEFEPEQKVDSPPESSKKVLFQRLWSDEDEIVILKGMLDYVAKKKLNPVADMDAFLDFIKNSLHVEVSKGQLSSKVRRLKKRYVNSKVKSRPVKPNELEAHLLSKAIWGDEDGKKELMITSPKSNGSVVRKSKSQKDNAFENEDDDDNVEIADGNVAERKCLAMRMTRYVSNVNEKIMKIGEELFEGENEIDGSKEWKKLINEEMKINLKKTQLVMDALNR